MSSRKSIPFLLLLIAGMAHAQPNVDASGGARAAEGEVTLHFVITTDFHGHLQAASVPIADRKEELRIGGSAMWGSYLANLRRQSPGRVVLLDGGDTITGTLEANSYHGAPVIRVYNLLGYDAMALGNHDLDQGQQTLLDRAAEAHFPILVANVKSRDTGKSWSAPGIESTVILDREGMKVGVVGLATPETPSTTMRSNVEGLEFLEPARIASEQAEGLRRRGAQVVAVVFHDGGGCEDNSDPDDLSTCDLEGPIFKLARALPPGIADLLVGGHTHTLVNKRIKGLPVVVAGCHGGWFGRVDITLSRVKGRVQKHRTLLHPLRRVCHEVFSETGDCDPEDPRGALVPASYAGAPVSEDPAVVKALAPIFRTVERIKARPLGVDAATSLTMDYYAESELGNLICDAMLAAVPEAKVALQNSGGIRAEVPPGPITFGEVYQVLPFDNRIAVIRLSGAQLLEIIRIGTSTDHGLTQMAGLKVRVDRRKEPALLSVRQADSKPLDPRSSYLVVTNDYLASGGSGYHEVLDSLEPGALDLKGIGLRDVVVRYLEQIGKAGESVDDPCNPLIREGRPRVEILGAAP